MLSLRLSRSPCEEAVEGSRSRVLLRVLEQACDAGDVRCGDLGDVVGPVLPVGAVADLLDDLGVDGAFDSPSSNAELAVAVRRTRLADRRSSHGLASPGRRRGCRLRSTHRCDRDDLDRSLGPCSRSIWLIIALKRSSWARSAWRTCQTTL